MGKIPIRVGLLAGALLSAPAGASGQAPAAIVGFQPLAEAASSEISAEIIAVSPREFSPAFASTTAKPPPSHLAQEGKASALWTGRVFLAKGKALDARAVSARIDSADLAAPEGWTRDDGKLTHRESGFECPGAFDFKTDGEDRVLALKDVSTYDERGRDVSSNYAIDVEASITIYTSFYPDLSLEDHAAGAVEAIAQNLTIKGTWPVTVVEIESQDKSLTTAALPAALSGAFDVGEFNGAPYKTAIWLAKTHGWHVKARATYAQTDFNSEVAAAVVFGVNYINVEMKNRNNPTTNGPEV